jgi:hypothetical protein
MTAVLGVIVVVVGLTALVLLLLYVRRSASAGDERSRAERLETELGTSAEQLRLAELRAAEETKRRVEAGEAADAAVREARAASAQADRRAEESAAQVEKARRHLEEAERRAADAEKRAARRGRRQQDKAESARGTAESSGPGGMPVADVADALWDLERLRLEREWYAIGGLAMPMPAGWDGADGTDLSAAVAVELEVIREVVGTPGHLYPPSQPVTADPATAIVITRLAGELMRTLARGGLELRVSIEDDDELAVAVATEAEETAEDLSRLATAASRAGGRLDVQTVDDGVKVEVRLPR